MSMILDALKRADRERRQQDLEVPTLDTNHGDGLLVARSRRRWLAWSSVLMLVLMGTAVFLWLQTPWQSESQLAETKPQTPSPAQSGWESEAPGTQTGEARLAQGQTEKEAQKTAIEALYQEQEQPQQDSGRKLTREEIASLYRQAVKDTADQTPDDQENETADRPANADTPLTTEALAVTPVSGAPQADIQAGEDSAQPQDNSRESASNTLPYIHTMPQSVQRNIPSINYQEHHYQPGGGSWVRLNRERKRVGDQISSELRIEAIDEKGLTLNYRGRSFRLGALNSWINM